MATYHVCDICGKELPQDKDNQYFLQIGPKGSYERTMGPIIVIHRNDEICLKCAHRINDYVVGLKDTLLNAEDVRTNNTPYNEEGTGV